MHTARAKHYGLEEWRNLDFYRHASTFCECFVTENVVCHSEKYTQNLWPLNVVRNVWGSCVIFTGIIHYLWSWFRDVWQMFTLSNATSYIISICHGYFVHQLHIDIYLAITDTLLLCYRYCVLASLFVMYMGHVAPSPLLRLISWYPTIFVRSGVYCNIRYTQQAHLPFYVAKSLFFKTLISKTQLFWILHRILQYHCRALYPTPKRLDYWQISYGQTAFGQIWVWNWFRICFSYFATTHWRQNTVVLSSSRNNLNWYVDQ